MCNELIKKELHHLGITPEIFWFASDKEFKERSGEGMYSLERHLEILIEEIGKRYVDLGRLKFIFRSFIACNSGQYIFQDVIDFLDSYCRQARITILTKGPDDLQSLKMAGLKRRANLKECFSEIVITQKDKGGVIDELCGEGNRLNVFIDDSLAQINSVNKARPDIITFWIKRRIKRANTEKSVDCKNIHFDYRVSSLIEVDKILSEII